MLVLFPLGEVVHHIQTPAVLEGAGWQLQLLS